LNVIKFLGYFTAIGQRRGLVFIAFALRNSSLGLILSLVIAKFSKWYPLHRLLDPSINAKLGEKKLTQSWRYNTLAVSYKAPKTLFLSINNHSTI